MPETEGPRFCTGCGALTNTGDLFCIRCGTQLQGAPSTGQSRGFAPPAPRSGAGGAEDLDWRKAFAWSAKIVLLYVTLFGVLGVVAPITFPLSPGLLINAMVLFAILAVVYAFVERRRRRNGAPNSGQARVDNLRAGILKSPNISKYRMSKTWGLLLSVALVVLLFGALALKFGKPAEIVSETPRDERNSTMVYSLVSGYDWGVSVYDVEMSGLNAQLDVNADDFRVTEGDARYICETTLDLSPGMIETGSSTYGHLEEVHVRGKSDMMSSDFTSLATCSW